MSGFLQPIVLEGRHVQLEPLTQAHGPALVAAASDGELWRLWYTGVPEAAGIGAYIEQALAGMTDGTVLAFAVRDRASGTLLGSTRYCHAEAAQRRLEIGYTWYGASVQRSAVNTECKYLLLRHAFEALDCIAVELRTHWMNQRSRAAIERLGAKQDGVLRNHRIMPDGSLRDTVVYSIIASEWPAVRQHLTFKLQQDYSS
jgi:RimJ/RimL family protein N-acetyltransferase